METWKSVVAVAVAGVFAVGTAWAQSPAPADKKTDKSMEKPMDKPADKADKTMDKSTDKSMDKSAEKMGKANKGMAKGGNREHVKAVQQALKDKGHDPGPVDGVMGMKTKAALKDFQKAQGLKDSGSLDNETMTKLGVEMKTGAASPSMPAKDNASASPSTSTDNAAKPKDNAPSASPSTAPSTSTDNAAKPKADAPAASPSTSDNAKPAEPVKPTEEKK